MLKFFNTVLVVLIMTSCQSGPGSQSGFAGFPQISGPYLGQPLPSDSARLFAPGIISTPLYTRDITMTPDGNEIYFCVSTLGLNLIFFTRQVEGIWTEPKPAPFIEDYGYMYYEPHITPDGKKMLFLSNQPAESGKNPNEDIWVVDRLENGWSKPYNLGEPVCTEHAEYYPSVTHDGTLYFSRQNRGERVTYIYRSRQQDGIYQTPEKLGRQVNCGTNRYNAFIDPQEKFIIVPATGMKDSRGGTDYYISFRDDNDNWSEPVNLGDNINSASGREYSASVSPDGRYLFFMSAKTFLKNASSIKNISYSKIISRFCAPQNGNSDIYWIDASFINRLKQN